MADDLSERRKKLERRLRSDTISFQDEDCHEMTYDLNLRLVLNREGTGYVEYKEQESMNGHYRDTSMNSWLCSSANLSFFDHLKMAYTPWPLIKAIKMGNEYYDKRLEKYLKLKAKDEEFIANFPNMKGMLDEVQTACQDYQKRLNRELDLSEPEPTSPRLASS